MAEKKLPERMCVCCRKMQEKRNLVRVVRTPEGGAEIDPTGKKNGRGAYLCKDPACVSRLLKTKPLGKILGVPVPEELYQSLREVLLG